jgi:hypothetical protein
MLGVFKGVRFDKLNRAGHIAWNICHSHSFIGSKYYIHIQLLSTVLPRQDKSLLAQILHQHNTL